MTSTVKRKSMALVMALLLCFSMFVSFETTAQAAGERSEIYMVSFPRDAEGNKNNWDRDNLQFMNGWYMEAYDMLATFAVGSYEGKVAYCIEPGTPIDNGHTFTAKDETFWDNYPSSLNKTIDADTIKSLIGRILQYGYNGNIDPTYLKLNVSYGSAKIVKTSEDGKVEGITFKITGNGINQTVTTNSRGEVQIDNLQPGEYTVTEQMAGDYVPQEPQKVTVQAGQTATVSFNNSLQKGSLAVTKNSEDGLNSGVRFHLSGTSSMGETVDLYATTNSPAVGNKQFYSAFNPIPPPFPIHGKGGGSGGYIPRRAGRGGTAGAGRQGQAAASGGATHP